MSGFYAEIQLAVANANHASLDKSIVLETSYFFGMRIIVFIFFLCWPSGIKVGK